jgi:hypothetical protein
MGIEDTEGLTPNFMRMQPFADFKADPKDTRLRLKEYKNSRIRDGKSVRAKKYNDLNAKMNLRYDLSGWPFASLLGAPITTAHAGSSVTSNIQVVSFGIASVGGVATSAATRFYLTVNGYTTNPITVGASAAITANNVALALSQLPSVGLAGTAVGLTTTSNCLSAGTFTTSDDGTRPVVTLTFQTSLANYVMPLITATILSGVGTVSVAHSTAGLGVSDNNYTGGISGMPTLGATYFDGASFKQYLAASVDSLDFNTTTDNFIQGDYKMLSKFEIDGGPTYSGLPTAVVVVAGTTATVTAATSPPITPTSIAGIYLNGTVYVANADGTNGENVTVTAVDGPTWKATGPGSGTFQFTYGGQTTSALPFGETAANVQIALRALSSLNTTLTVIGTAPYVITLGAGYNRPLTIQGSAAASIVNASTYTATYVTSKAAGFTITPPSTVSGVTAPVTAFGLQTITPQNAAGMFVGQPLLAANGDYQAPEVMQVLGMGSPTWEVRVPTSLSGSTFSLSYGGQTTPSINFGEVAGVVEAALEALTSISPSTGVTVVGVSSGYSITLPTGFNQALTGTLLTNTTFGNIEVSNQTTISVLMNKLKGTGWQIVTPAFSVVNAALTTAGSQTVTPVSMANIFVGAMLQVMDATGTKPPEVVTVTAVTATTFTAIFQTTKSARWVVIPINVPTLIESAYNQPVDPTQIAITLGGQVFTGVKNLKMTFKGNRDPLHTLGGGLDLTSSLPLATSHTSRPSIRSS